MLSHTKTEGDADNFLPQTKTKTASFRFFYVNITNNFPTI